jgi:hypothetical protein
MRRAGGGIFLDRITELGKLREGREGFFRQNLQNRRIKKKGRQAQTGFGRNSVNSVQKTGWVVFETELQNWEN